MRRRPFRAGVGTAGGAALSLPHLPEAARRGLATYASVPRADLRYIAGEQWLTTYNSSAGVQRRFCSRCGSDIEWRGSAEYPDWVSIPVAALDTPLQHVQIKHIHLESRASWHTAPPTSPKPPPSAAQPSA